MVKQSVGRTAELLKERILGTSSGINMLMIGQAGVGKSTIIGDLANCRIDEKTKKTYTEQEMLDGLIDKSKWDKMRKVRVFDIRLSAYTVNDITISMPVTKDTGLEGDFEALGSGKIKHTMKTFYADWVVKLTEAAEAGEKIVLFFDELTHAQLPVLRIMYRILAEREIDDVKLPDDMVVIGASNKVEEDSQMTELPSPLLDRFQLTLELVTDVSDSIKYYMSKKYYTVASFIKTFNDKLYATIVDKEMTKTISPRTWEKIGKLVNEGTIVPCDEGKMRDGIKMEFSGSILNGILGIELGSAFKTFLDNALDVDIRGIIDRCDFGSNSSNQIKYAIFSGMINELLKMKASKDKKQGAQILRFTEYLFNNDKQYLSVLLLEKELKAFVAKNTRNQDLQSLIFTLV